MSKKTWIMSGISAVALIVLAAVIIIQQNNQPKKTVAAFTEAVKEKDTAQLKEMIDPDNNGTEVNNQSVKAFAAYLKANDSSFDAIKDGLNEQVEDENFSPTNQQVSLIESGEKWGIFKEYKLRVKTGFIKVTGQHDEDELSLTVGNMKEFVKEREKNTYGPFLPGTYNTVTTIKNKLGTFMKKDKIDIWGGSKEVTLIVDPDSLARNDQDVQKAVMSAVHVFNQDWAVFETSGFDTDTLTNVADGIKDDTLYVAKKFEMVEEYVEEVHSKYLGAVLNLDDLDISYFDNQWRAEAKAVASYDSKLKMKNNKKAEDLSYEALRDYSMIYKADKKKWVIEEIEESEADGVEEDWENTKEMKIKNPKLHKWNQKDSSKGL